MCGSNSSKNRKSLGDNLSAINSICTKIDIRRDFAKLHRVQCAGSSLWTTPDGVKHIQEECDNFNFEQAMKVQADLERKLKSQEQDIKQLRDGNTITVTSPSNGTSQEHEPDQKSTVESDEAGTNDGLESVTTAMSKSTISVD